MIKRNVLLIIVVIIWVSSLNAQIINLNPDPNGEPWYVGDLSEITPEIQARLDSIPEMIISEVSLHRVLRDVVDNSNEIYFPPIFQQQGGSCAQAAGVYYTFTYEINRLRNLPSDVEENMYPTHYTYNYLNHGDNSCGSTFIDGWLIIKIYSGCPTVATWEGIAGLDYKWMTGYDKYYSATQNRSISENYINIETPEGLDLLKQWIDHHNVGADVGGIACFGVYWSGYQTDVLPPESAEAGKSIFTQLGTNPNSGHALTFVGYNDGVMYDFDGNGQFTDDEIGAFKIANSWGDHWPTENDEGFCYLPYWLVLEGGSPWMRNAYTIEPIENHIPQMTFKVTMTHSARNKINIKAGISEDITLTVPYEMNTQRYMAYNFRDGGLLPMQGISDEPIEIGLDISSIIEETTPNKFFLVIDEDDEDDQYNGEIINFSIIDYRDGEEFEISYPETNVQILNDTSTILPITIFLPHEISEDMLIEDFIYIRGDTHVLQGAELTFASYTKVYLIDGRLIVDEGASLIIEDRVIFTGNNVTIPADETNPEEILGDRIEIYGELSIDDNVLFTAPEDKSWDGLYLYNNTSVVTINNVTFERCKLHNESKRLDIGNSTFINSHIEQLGNRLYLSNSSFVNSSINSNYLAPPPPPCPLPSINISDCSFIGCDNYAVSITGYDRYELCDNEISECGGGFYIYESGAPRARIISNNTIENNVGCGIMLYHSYADILHHNSIIDNSMGIFAIHSSSMRIVGDVNPPYSLIQDNINQEIAFDGDSYPEETYHNKIIDDVYDEGTLDQYLMAFFEFIPVPPFELNVEDNYWGVDYGDHRFFPSDYFDYIPIWNPGTPESPENSSPGQLYAEADSLIEQENYEQAKLVYKDIIELYPESKYAIFSMRNLLPLETVSGQDFSSLQGYYLTDPNCNYDSERSKLSSYLANYCKIKLKNYPEAISFFEDIIENPDTELDSVYAVIDAGYTYLLMEDDSVRASYIGRIAELKPKSVAEFESTRDRLLAKVLGIPEDDEDEEEIIPENIFYLGQNYPNPFSSSTIISFNLATNYTNLHEQARIRIYNIKGQLVKTFRIPNPESQTPNIVWDGKDENGKNVSSGIYLYNLSVGKKNITKKMIILR
ncbi:MAG: T9SS type A sorting domain-containing protein [Candidatus Cloacimonetes bacterium]|nr:T9SS type A sorting domain-containing protein [Candidatus Cloacimonadota bacterium]MBL7086928.1 T9SS type A sorting domain-containing protein [Candidatus Cloacimonadota bacterium]